LLNQEADNGNLQCTVPHQDSFQPKKARVKRQDVLDRHETGMDPGKRHRRWSSKPILHPARWGHDPTGEALFGAAPVGA
jgi:hypothetical protein